MDEANISGTDESKDLRLIVALSTLNRILLF